MFRLVGLSPVSRQTRLTLGYHVPVFFTDLDLYNKGNIKLTSYLMGILYPAFPSWHQGQCYNRNMTNFVDVGVPLRRHIISEMSVTNGATRNLSFYLIHPGSFRVADIGCPDISWGHDDVIKWKHFPRYWSFVRGIHRWPLVSPHKGQCREALMFFYLRLNKCFFKTPVIWDTISLIMTSL